MKQLAIAHRGYHQHFHENTVEAFEEAGKLDYFGIETDIHLSKDKKWVIHHNFDIESDKKLYPIRKFKYEELKKMRLDDENANLNPHICELKDYLEICKKSGKRPIIEIKPKFLSFHYLKKLLKEIEKYFNRYDVTIIAFYPWPLIMLRMMDKKLHLQQLIFDKLFLADWAIKRKMDIDIDFHYLTPELVKKMHDRNLKVNVWTVDDDETLKKVLDLGVDYVTTNVFNQNN